MTKYNSKTIIQDLIQAQFFHIMYPNIRSFFRFLFYNSFQYLQEMISNSSLEIQSYIINNHPKFPSFETRLQVLEYRVSLTMERGNLRFKRWIRQIEQDT